MEKNKGHSEKIEPRTIGQHRGLIYVADLGGFEPTAWLYRAVEVASVVEACSVATIEAEGTSVVVAAACDDAAASMMTVRVEVAARPFWSVAT